MEQPPATPTQKAAAAIAMFLEPTKEGREQAMDVVLEDYRRHRAAAGELLYLLEDYPPPREGFDILRASAREMEQAAEEMRALFVGLADIGRILVTALGEATKETPADILQLIVTNRPGGIADVPE